MTTLREAAQQALENAEDQLAKPYSTDASNAITALRAALAQVEPVCKCDLRTRLLGDGCDVCNPELAAELAQQAEPAQRQPLTYEEMLDLISAEGGNNLRIPLALAINLIRATEQAHGIKEAK